MVNKTGLFAEGTAKTGAEVGANIDVNYGNRGGQWNTEGTAGVTAEATGKMSYTKDGFEHEIGTQVGPYAEAKTKLGTENSHIGVGVKAGGASVNLSRHGKVDWENESLILGGCNELSLIAGGSICVSHEILNPLDKEKRQKYYDGFTSGDPKTVAKTLYNAGKELYDAAYNPHIIASEMLGWKARTKSEKFIAKVPGVNMIAGIGRSWGLWQLQQLQQQA